MKALILASGSGTRLKPLSNLKPKCLTEILGRTILDYQFAALKENSIRDIILTTGPFQDQMTAFIESYKQDFNITLINNTKYAETNYIYSMHLAQNALQDDIILMHGDLVFEPNVLTKLLTDGRKNSAAMRWGHQPQNDFKGLIIDGKVHQISIHLFDRNSHFLAPLYKFNRADFQTWMDKIKTFINRGQVNCYAEDALNDLLPKNIDLYPVFFKNSICMEIDELKDIEELIGLLSSRL